MVKTVAIWTGKKRRYIFLVAGVTKRLAIGIAIERWSASIDFGPFWISVEW